nr:MAG TPA: hypothetical protein [Caudoviricetes sp.]
MTTIATLIKKSRADKFSYKCHRFSFPAQYEQINDSSI